jgi:CDP-diacylglycerol---serine O-phosphatidyltransferase
MTKAFIPNFITALNLVFGVFAIFSVFDGDFRMAAIYIVAAVVADSLDGRVARYLGVSGEFGKEFDSLCDLGSFGVAPAVMAYAFMLKDFGWIGYITAAFFACCGAYRLARFNVNASTVKGYFMGLPIPAGGAIIATFVMLQIRLPGWFFPLFVAFVGYLMVSTVKYPDFKGQGEKIRPLSVIVTLALVAALLVYRPDAWLFAPFLAFMLFGPVNTFFRRIGQ